MHAGNDAARECPRLPALLAGIGRRLPTAPLRPVVARLLERVFAEALADGSLELLEGREFAICVEDLGLQLGFTQTAGRLQVTSGDSADALIRGPAAAFTWLAAKRADPDTLFFHRHLVMEGDTELGLTIKNLLDATDLDALPVPLQQGLNWLAERVPGQPPGAGFMPG